MHFYILVQCCTVTGQTDETDRLTDMQKALQHYAHVHALQLATVLVSKTVLTMSRMPGDAYILVRM